MISVRAVRRTDPQLYREVHTVAPAAGEQLYIESALSRLQEYGLNTSRNAAKGRTIWLDVSFKVLAELVKYGVNNASRLVIE